MKLENQLVNFELSNKLKKLGVKQESIWYWLKINDEWKLDFHLVEYPEGITQPTESISAFTVAELGEMLPNKVKNKLDENCTEEERVMSPYHLIDLPYKCPLHNWKSILISCTDRQLTFISGETEADARAKMLIYLIEKGYIKVGEKNE